MKTGKPMVVTAAKSRFLRRRRVLKGLRDVERGVRDTERRGTPNDLPVSPGERRRRA